VLWLQVLVPVSAQAGVGRVRVSALVAEELMEVRLAGLTGVNDRIVAQDLTGSTDEAERTNVVGRS
jgi:hypothetical protein